VLTAARWWAERAAHGAWVESDTGMIAMGFVMKLTAQAVCTYNNRFLGWCMLYYKVDLDGSDVRFAIVTANRWGHASNRANII